MSLLNSVDVPQPKQTHTKSERKKLLEILTNNNQWNNEKIWNHINLSFHLKQTFFTLDLAVAIAVFPLFFSNKIKYRHVGIPSTWTAIMSDRIGVEKVKFFLLRKTSKKFDLCKLSNIANEHVSTWAYLKITAKLTETKLVTQLFEPIHHYFEIQKILNI